MREVVIQSWCDECAALNEDVIGEPIDINWKGREYSLDLCEEHAAPFDEVHRLIVTYGHVTSSRPKTTTTKSNGNTSRKNPSDAYLTPDGQYQCPECERVIGNAQGLGAHRTKAHGTSIKASTK